MLKIKINKDDFELFSIFLNTLKKFEIFEKANGYIGQYLGHLITTKYDVTKQDIQEYLDYQGKTDIGYRVTNNNLFVILGGKKDEH